MTSPSLCSSPFSFSSSSPLLPLPCSLFSPSLLSLRRAVAPHSALNIGSKLSYMSPKKDRALAAHDFSRNVSKVAPLSCKVSFGRRDISSEEGSREESPTGLQEKETPLGKSTYGDRIMLSSFGPPLDSFGNYDAGVSETKFQMTLAELLEKSGVTPTAIYGDLDALITGVQDDSREVCQGDLFISRVGSKTDGHLYLTEACNRGAVALVVGEESVEAQILRCGCKAVVVVNATDSALPVIAATFYGHPSRSLFVVGVTGTNGKTTTTNLVRSIFETMGYGTGLFGTVCFFINGDEMLEASRTTPDAVPAQRLMAKMVRSGTKALVMETSSEGWSREVQ
ncbi:unnamed protein product [Musa acuminata var. zebrina]